MINWQPDHIRARLRELVAADGRTHEAIANACPRGGMNVSQFGNVLNGFRYDPRVGTIGRMLAALGLSWEALDGHGPLSDEALCEIADERFLALDEEEANGDPS